MISIKEDLTMKVFFFLIFGIDIEMMKNMILRNTFT